MTERAVPTLPSRDLHETPALCTRPEFANLATEPER